MFESVDSLSQGHEATHIPILVYKCHSFGCLKDVAKIKDEYPFMNTLQWSFKYHNKGILKIKDIIESC